MKDRTDAEARKKVWEMIQDIRIAQLVTHHSQEGLCSRPMAAMNKDFNGTLWYFTSEGSPKIADIEHNPDVLLCYSRPSKQEYISIQGKARVSNDRTMIAELWSEYARPWFPQGKDDASIRLISVDITRAQYWDSATDTLELIYGYVYARVTGKTPDAGENRKVAF